MDSEEPPTSHYSLTTDNSPTTNNSISRSGETLRQSDWRDELMKTGIRGKAGQYINFARLEPLPGAPRLLNLHADGETLPNDDGPSTIREGAAFSVTAGRRILRSGPRPA